jgi:hypothetical protein
MPRRNTTAAMRPAAEMRYDRRDVASDIAPMIRELEAENVGLRNTVIDLALQVVALRESLPAGVTCGMVAVRIGAAQTAGRTRQES